MDLNVFKTKEMVVFFKREKPRIHDTLLRIFRTPIEKANIRYLGVHISEGMTWTTW